MNDVQVILNSFLREELDFQQLQRELSGALRSDPDARWQALGMLRELRGANRISQRLHEILKTEIQHGLLDGFEDDTQVITEQMDGGTSNGNGNAIDAPTWTSDIRVGSDQEDVDDGFEDDADVTRAVLKGPAKRPKKNKTAAKKISNNLPKKSKRPLGAGSVLKGRFVLESRLGRGGMGVVYKALDQRRKGGHEHSPYVALKVLREDFKSHPDSLNALQRESQEAQRLSHPNIVNVFDFDRDDDTYFMTMELLHGEPLSQLFSRHHPQPVPREEAFRIIRGMGQGLMCAHEHNVVHLDFKPGNVFLTEAGVVKILDFGIAQATNAPGQTEFTLGFTDSNSLNAMTPAYASCERLDGAGPDPRDDVYALGCVAYELLAGKHPFNKKTATDARTENLVPEKIKDLTRKQWKAMTSALALERNQRSSSVGHFLDELGVLPADVSPYLSAENNQRGPRPRKHTGTHWGVGTMVVAALLGTLGYFGSDEILAMLRGDWQMQRLAITESTTKATIMEVPKIEAPPAKEPQQETQNQVATSPPDEVEAGSTDSANQIITGDITINTIGEENPELESPDPVGKGESTGIDEPVDQALEEVVEKVDGQKVEIANIDPAPALSVEPQVADSGVRRPSIAEDDQSAGIIEDVIVDTNIAATAEVPVVNTPGTFAFSEDTVTVREGDGAIFISIVRTDGDQGAARVMWSTNSVTADAERDYGRFKESVESFAAGEREKKIFIPLVSDSQPEGNESFFVSLFSPSEGAKLGFTTQVLITIIDDD